MTKAILECNGIAAGYVKGLNILQGVDLVVNQGEIVSIIGPNGAGKSTLLKAIMSLIKISAGRFFVNGEEKTDLSTHKIVMEGIGYVPQVANVFPSLTIDENLEIGTWSIKRGKKDAVGKKSAQVMTKINMNWLRGALGGARGAKNKIFQFKSVP